MAEKQCLAEALALESQILRKLGAIDRHPPIPLRVLTRVQHALSVVQAWNRAICQARDMEAVARQPGRYEADLRHGLDASSVQLRLRLACALDLLTQFEAQAQANGVDPATVYATLGGKPLLLAEGPQVHAWRARA